MSEAASKTPTSLAVFVVDDDPDVRDALGLLLRVRGYETALFACAEDFLTLLTPAASGCLVADIRMPGMSGLELQQVLNQRGTLTPIIFITGHGDVPMAVEAMQQGAFDFLQKPFRDQELLDRVQRAIEKDRSVREQLRGNEAIRRRLESLTAREHDVLELVAAGAPNKIIAHKLGISQRTVEIHRARVMEKMNADSLAQLVHMTLLTGAPHQKAEAPSQQHPA